MIISKITRTVVAIFIGIMLGVLGVIAAMQTTRKQVNSPYVVSTGDSRVQVNIDGKIYLVSVPCKLIKEDR